jgi:hypothetical protein
MKHFSSFTLREIELDYRSSCCWLGFATTCFPNVFNPDTIGGDEIVQ